MRGLPSRRRWDRAFRVLASLAALFTLALPLVLVGDVLLDGVGALSRHFFTDFPSRFPEKAGIRGPLVGTLWILALTGGLALPVSVGAAIYLEEYAPRNWMTRAIRANIAGLAGVPSIVFGILGLAFFVRILGLGQSLMAGALTLAILVMPMIILASQEALRSVPRGIREAAYGVGATRWQVVRHQVLPAALPDILSGAVMALARAVGETAPFIMIGVLAFLPFSPHGVDDPFTVLPLQIFNWITRGEEFTPLAAGGIIVLLGILVTMGVLAALVRRPHGDRRRS